MYILQIEDRLNFFLTCWGKTHVQATCTLSIISLKGTCISYHCFVISSSKHLMFFKSINTSSSMQFALKIEFGKKKNYKSVNLFSKVCVSICTDVHLLVYDMKM